MLKEYQHKDLLAKVIGGRTAQYFHKGGMKFRNTFGKKHAESIDETHFTINCILYKVFLNQPLSTEYIYQEVCNALRSRKLDFERKVVAYHEDEKIIVFKINYYSPFGIDETLLKRNKVELAQATHVLTLEQLERIHEEIKYVPKPKGFDFNDFIPKSTTP